MPVFDAWLLVWPSTLPPVPQEALFGGECWVNAASCGDVAHGGNVGSHLGAWGVHAVNVASWLGAWGAQWRQRRFKDTVDL